MNLHPYLSFDVRFDLKAYPMLRITDTSQYPVGVAGQKVWYELTQPDGIMLPVGSSSAPHANPVINLRLDSLQRFQRGLYIIKMYVAHDSDLSTFSRYFEFGYDRVELKLVEDFDVFTPRLLYRDKTDYDVLHYDVVASTIHWHAIVGENGSIGQLDGNTATFDLAYNGSYYSTKYIISFERVLTYQHESYPWLSVEDRYGRTISTQAVEPPTIPQMLESLRLMHDNLMNDCGCGCSEHYRDDYVYANSLLQHLITAITNGQSEGITVLLNQFINVTNNITQVVTNNVMYAFNYTTVGGNGGGTTTLVLDIDSEVDSFTTTGLAGKTIVSIDVDGIERRFTEGSETDVPAYGQFIFVKATGGWKYGGTLQQGQWIKIEYNL